MIYTWGNVSSIDREKGLVVIKPSDINYGDMKPEDMVVVDLMTGEKVEEKYKPSSDTVTHFELYRAFPSIGDITHIYFINEISFAWAGLDIPALRTTHADYFYGDIPCTRELREVNVEEAYEQNMSKVIGE